jgi:hypothetical protein
MPGTQCGHRVVFLLIFVMQPRQIFCISMFTSSQLLARAELTCTQMEIKMLLAHLMLHYDIAYPVGKTLPPPLTIDAATIPDPKAHLVFKKR